MKAVRRVFAVIVGFVFTIAGLLKLMDPVGAGLVVEEYLKFLHLPFLIPAAKVLGTTLAAFESVLGAALITGVWRRVTGILTGAVLGFFTLLTFFLWLRNPEMDCGCFGEAIHLSHLQSLVKNLILLVFWAIAFIPLSRCGMPPKVKYVSFSIAAVSILLFTLYSSLSIPMMDFTPFKPGAEIQSEGTTNDPDAPVLSFCDSDGEYCDSLATGGSVMVISVYDPSTVKPSQTEDIAALVNACTETGISPMVLVAGTGSCTGCLQTYPEIMTRSWFADRRMLLTLNRSNGGATLLCDGMVIRKWAVRSLPGTEELEDAFTMDPMETMIDSTSSDRLRMQGFLLYLFAVMLLL